MRHLRPARARSSADDQAGLARSLSSAAVQRWPPRFWSSVADLPGPWAGHTPSRAPRTAAATAAPACPVPPMPVPTGLQELPRDGHAAPRRGSRLLSVMMGGGGHAHVEIMMMM